MVKQNPSNKELIKSCKNCKHCQIIKGLATYKGICLLCFYFPDYVNAPKTRKLCEDCWEAKDNV